MQKSTFEAIKCLNSVYCFIKCFSDFCRRFMFNLNIWNGLGAEEKWLTWFEVINWRGTYLLLITSNFR